MHTFTYFSHFFLIIFKKLIHRSIQNLKKKQKTKKPKSRNNVQNSFAVQTISKARNQTVKVNIFYTTKDFDPRREI